MDITSEQIEAARRDIAETRGVTLDRIWIKKAWLELNPRNPLRTRLRIEYDFIRELVEEE